jgi:hypothetical protein
MKAQILLAVFALGCGGSKSNDYSGKKLVSHDVTVDGVAFSISVPEGLPKDKRNAGSWSDARAEYDHVPHVFTSIVTTSAIENLERAKYSAVLRVSEAHFVREEQRPDGFAFTDADPDKSHLDAITFRRAAGDKVIKCNAAQVAEGALPSYDKTRAMLEAICDSVKPK